MHYLKLCLVTHPKNQSLAEYPYFIERAIQGGVTSIQLRMKNSPEHEIIDWGQQLKTILDPLGIPLMINDNPHIAAKIDAAGVHLGQSDTPPEEARKIIGPNKIIGLSIETWDELEHANQLTCLNYVSASAVFATQSKSNIKTIWGIEGLKKLTQLSKHPVIAIGGINTTNASSVMASGVCGIAVVSAIENAADPLQAAKELSNYSPHVMPAKADIQKGLNAPSSRDSIAGSGK